MDIVWLHDVSEPDARIAAKLVVEKKLTFEEGQTIPPILEQLSKLCIHKTSNGVGRTTYVSSEGLSAWFNKLDEKTRVRLLS